MNTDSKAIKSDLLMAIGAAWIAYVVCWILAVWLINDTIIFLIAGLFLYTAGCGLLGYSLASTLFRKGSTPFVWAYGGLALGFISEITIPLIITRF